MSEIADQYPASLWLDQNIYSSVGDVPPQIELNPVLQRSCCCSLFLELQSIQEVSSETSIPRSFSQPFLIPSNLTLFIDIIIKFECAVKTFTQKGTSKSDFSGRVENCGGYGSWQTVELEVME